MKSENNIENIITERSIKYPNNVAFRELKDNKEQNVTYKQLKEQVRDYSEKFKSVYASRNKMALYGENSIEWIKVYLSIIISNNIVLPLDANIGIQEMINLLNKFGVGIIFVSDNVDEVKRQVLIEQGFKVYTYYEIRNLKNDYIDIATKYKIYDNNCNVLYFTSGTTGEYKAVMLNQEHLMSDCKALHDILNFEKGSVFLNVLPFHHSFAIMCDILYGLFVGATICVCNLKKFTEELLYYNPNYIFAVPLIAENVLKYLDSKNKAIGLDDKLKTKCMVVGDNLKTILCGGAIIKGELKEQLGTYHINLIKGYGITECAPVVSVTSPKTSYNLDSVGTPLNCNRVKIEDGEILVSGENVMFGYYTNEVETIKAFDGKWFRTGDLGYLDANKNLYITGRKKNLIILDNGENISAEYLEMMLNKYCLLENFLVFEERDFDGKGKLSVAIFNDSFIEECINEKQLNDIIDKFNRCENVRTRICCGYIINANPVRTSTQKIRRMESLELLAGSIISKKLIAILRNFLYESQPISIDSHLYNDLGLDSFELYRLVSVLEEQLAIEIEVNDIIHLNKIGDIVAHIISKYVLFSEISVTWKIKVE